MPLDAEDKKALPATAAALTLATGLLAATWYYATHIFDPEDPVANGHDANTVTLELPKESVKGFLSGEYDATQFHAEVQDALDAGSAGGHAAPAPGH